MVKWEASIDDEGDDESVDYVDAAMDARVLRLENDLRWYNRLVSRDRVRAVVWFVVVLLVRTVTNQLFGRLSWWLIMQKNDPDVSGISSGSLYLLMSVVNAGVDLTGVFVSVKAMRAMWGLN